MPNVLNEFPGDGVQTTFNFAMAGGYLDQAYVKFYTRPNDSLLEYTEYTGTVTWVGPYEVSTSAPFPVGTTFVILRDTPVEPLVDFQNTSRITEKNLDTATWQSLHVAAETSDTMGRVVEVMNDTVAVAQEALEIAEASGADADAAAASALAAQASASAAQTAANAAALSANDAASLAGTANTTANTALSTANSAASTAGTALTTANSAASAASSATTTANSAAASAASAVSTANAANATANTASSTANSAASAAAAAVITANDAAELAQEAKDLIDEAVSGAVVSFNGRAGTVVPQSGDYDKGQVGLGNVDNTSDADKPISTLTQAALDTKANTTAVAASLATKADITYVDSGLSTKASTSQVATDIASASTADRARTNHTGTQATSTIVGLVAWMANPSAVKSLNGGHLGGARNLFRNSTMCVAQRGTSFSSPSTFTLDGIFYGASHDGALTITQENASPPTGIANYLRATVTSADTSLTGLQNATISQGVEGYDVAHLVGVPFVASFWARSSITGTFGVSFRNSGRDRTFLGTFTVAAANVWVRYEIPVSAGLITAGTWNWTNALGLSMDVCLGVGPTGQATAGSWQSGNYLSTSAQTNLLAATGRTLDLTGLQLEVGTVATALERVSMAQELERCFRYYQAGVRARLAGPSSNGADVGVGATFPVMRSSPTVENLVISSAGAVSGGTITVTSNRAFDFMMTGTGSTAMTATATFNLNSEV